MRPINSMLRRGHAVVLAVALFAPVSAPAQQQDHGFFPYPVHKRTLANGLDVIVIPMPQFKDVLSYNTLVNAGSRNEVEKGKSGLAHLFEHILFRHRYAGADNGYEDAITRMGAFNNAFTNQDLTFYYPLTFAANLEPLARLEADRFVRLDFGEKIFRTEAGAVLGEYRRSAASPGLRISEVQRRLLFGDHGYGHTTIGYLEDVEDMPNEYEAAVKFYSDWYRPNNTVVVVAGDVQRDSVFRLVEALYGSWQPRPLPALPPAGPVGGPKREHVEWPADVPPRVSVSYRVPRHESSAVETGVLQLLPELLTGQTADLYQELRFRKGTAAALSSGGGESFGPGIFEIAAVLFQTKFEERGSALLDETVDDIVAATDALKRFSQRADAAALLEELKSKFAYDLLAGLDSPPAVARRFAWYYRFERDPRVFDRLMAAVRAVTPSDIEGFAQAYFTPESRVIVTLAPARPGRQ